MYINIGFIVANDFVNQQKNGQVGEQNWLTHIKHVCQRIGTSMKYNINIYLNVE